MSSPVETIRGAAQVEALASLSAVCVDERAAIESPQPEPPISHSVVPLERLLSQIRADQGAQPLTLWISHGGKAAPLCDRVPVPTNPAALSQLWFGVSQTLHQLNQSQEAPSGAPADPQPQVPKGVKRAFNSAAPSSTPSSAAVVSAPAGAPEDSKESWIEGSKRVKANPPRARTIPAEWKEKVTPEYALAQVAKVGGVNILQDERNKHISWRKVARTIEAELGLRPRGNCNQILKKMVEDATGLDLRQRVSQVVGDCAFVVRRRGKSDKQKPPGAAQRASTSSAPVAVPVQVERIPKHMAPLVAVNATPVEPRQQAHVQTAPAVTVALCNPGAKHEPLPTMMPQPTAVPTQRVAALPMATVVSVSPIVAEVPQVAHN